MTEQIRESLLLEPAKNLKLSMLQLAHDICAAEIVMPVTLKERTLYEEWKKLGWTDSSIFATPLLLPYVKVEHTSDDFRVVAASFELPEEDTVIKINRKGDDRLNEDPFVAHVYGRFKEVYDQHPHENCTPIDYYPHSVQAKRPEKHNPDGIDWYNS